MLKWTKSPKYQTLTTKSNENANESYEKLPKSLLTPFQLKNTNKDGFDSYLDEESEIGFGKEMSSWNKENGEDEEDGDRPKLSLQTQATIP